MASCQQMQARLPEYIHELLDASALTEVSHHLDRCTDCAREHARLVRGFRAMDAWEVPGPRGDGFARFQEALRHGPVEGREPRIRGRIPEAVGAKPRWMRLALAWGSLCAVCLLVGFVILPLWLGAYEDSLVARNQEQIAALASQGRLPEALATCRNWAAEGPDRKAAQMALAALEDGREENARLEGHLRRAVTANPAARSDRLRLGDALRLQGKLEEARKEYLKAVAQDENSVEAYLKLARTAEALNRPREAREHLESAMRIAPDDRRVIALATRLNMADGGSAELAERFRRAAENPTPDHPSLFDLAVRLRR